MIVIDLGGFCLLRVCTRLLYWFVVIYMLTCLFLAGLHGNSCLLALRVGLVILVDLCDFLTFVFGV